MPNRHPLTDSSLRPIFEHRLVRLKNTMSMLLAAALVFTFPLMAQSDWGGVSDIRVTGDFDGDGKLDYAFWRPATGTWYVRLFVDPTALTTDQWGQGGDIPVAADYDGDGKTDYAVWRPTEGNWYIKLASGAPSYVVQWGQPGDSGGWHSEWVWIIRS
jgi:hypothetical protein